MPSDFISTCMSTRRSTRTRSGRAAGRSRWHTPSSGTRRRTTYGSPAASRRATSSAVERQTQAVVARRPSRGALRDAHLFEPFRRAEAVERVAARQQFAGVLAHRLRERSLWRYGPCGPPTSGPSSQRRPHQRSASRIARSLSAVLRARSVSSMRRTNWPPCLLGEAVVDQRDVGRADVRVAGRRRRDARADRSWRKR